MAWASRSYQFSENRMLPRPESLPRYLSESEYNRLKQVVVEQTDEDTPRAARDRAWFFTLAHTGVRISELLNLRVGDLDPAGGRLLCCHRARLAPAGLADKNV